VCSLRSVDGKPIPAGGAHTAQIELHLSYGREPRPGVPRAASPSPSPGLSAGAGAGGSGSGEGHINSVPAGRSPPPHRAPAAAHTEAGLRAGAGRRSPSPQPARASPAPAARRAHDAPREPPAWLSPSSRAGSSNKWLQEAGSSNKWLQEAGSSPPAPPLSARGAAPWERASASPRAGSAGTGPEGAGSAPLGAIGFLSRGGPDVPQRRSSLALSGGASPGLPRGMARRAAGTRRALPGEKTVVLTREAPARCAASPPPFVLTGPVASFTPY